MTRWLFILIILCACSPQVIQYRSTSASYSTYKTYALLSLKGEKANMEDYARDAIKRLEVYTRAEMSRRGYVESSNNPDLVLRYEAISSTVSQTNYNNSSPYGYSSGYVQTSHSIESVLLFEMTDQKTKKLVWQASMDVEDIQKTAKKKDAVLKTVTRIFNTYLYRAGQKEPDPQLKTK